MRLDLAAVAREAAARWRQDRALLWPLAGLLLFVPQWAMLLLVPEAPRLPAAAPADTGAMAAWAAAAEAWAQRWGSFYLVAFVVAQWGQLAAIALYVGPAEPRPTLGRALLLAGRLLPRFVLAGLIVAFPLGAGMLAAMAAPAVMALAIPVVVWALGRTLLIGPALVARAPIGAARAVAASWRWTAGNGFPLAMLAAILVIGVPIATGLVRSAGDALTAANLATPVALAALDAIAAAIAAAAMLALAMIAGVLYRRLAR